MNARKLFIAVLALMCAALVWQVFAHGSQVSELQTEHKRLEALSTATNSPAPEIAATPPAAPEVPRELLQLRAEVARLSEQQRGLAGVRRENQQLWLHLQNRGANNAAVKGAGYLRMSEVKWRGYNTPDDTLQSAFWAVQNRDLEKYLEAIRPDVAKELADALRTGARSVDDLFKDKHLPPVYRITGRRQDDEENVVLQVEIAPDIPPQGIFLRKVAGQWKLESSF